MNKVRDRIEKNFSENVFRIWSLLSYGTAAFVRQIVWVATMTAENSIIFSLE